MRNRRIIAWVLAVVPLIITAVVLPVLPDKIPAHYGFDGSADRFGSKYEMLIFPLATICMGFFWLLMERILLKDKDKGQQNSVVLFWSNISVSLTFTVLNILFLHAAYTNAANLYSGGGDGGMDLVKATAVTLSVVCVISGNIIPKCKQNSLIGIRTKWTLASESVWYKTHRFGGKVLFASGVISGLLCIFIFGGAASFCISFGALAAATVITVIYSYYIYKYEM
jgi:uncharacterized membrane protein